MFGTVAFDALKYVWWNTYSFASVSNKMLDPPVPLNVISTMCNEVSGKEEIF